MLQWTAYFRSDYAYEFSSAAFHEYTAKLQIANEQAKLFVPTQS